MPTNYALNTTGRDLLTTYADTTSICVDPVSNTIRTRYDNGNTVYYTEMDYPTWINTEWITGNWWYRRQSELWEADQIKFNNLFDDTYHTVTETDKDSEEDFDTTEINKYLETLREEVVETED